MGKKSTLTGSAALSASAPVIQGWSPAVDWEPPFTLDLNTSSAAAFKQLLADFYEWRKTQDEPDITFPDGWHTITPEMAWTVLLTQSPDANRQPSFATVQYYAKQMERGDWQPTGQPVIFDVQGNLVDAQHRMLAAALGGHSFETYVVNQQRKIERGFVYIDNIKARSSRDALYTAGMNGTSGTLSQMVKLAQQHEEGALTPDTAAKVERLTPHQVVVFAETRPHLRRGFHIMASEYKPALSTIFWDEVGGYMAALIIQLYDEDTLYEFMSAIGTPDDTEDSPISAFQSEMERDRKQPKDKKMKRHAVFGYLIKAFNAWVTNTKVNKKRFYLKVNEPFPEIVAPNSVAEAAE